jgi:hypothetical protein
LHPLPVVLALAPLGIAAFLSLAATLLHAARAHSLLGGLDGQDEARSVGAASSGGGGARDRSMRKLCGRRVTHARASTGRGQAVTSGDVTAAGPLPLSATTQNKRGAMRHIRSTHHAAAAAAAAAAAHQHCGQHTRARVRPGRGRAHTTTLGNTPPHPPPPPPPRGAASSMHAHKRMCARVKGTSTSWKPRPSKAAVWSWYTARTRSVRQSVLSPPGVTDSTRAARGQNPTNAPPR